MNRVQLARQLGELKIDEILGRQPWLLACDEGFADLFAEWGVPASRILRVDAIDQELPSHKEHKFAVVCTEKPEGVTQKRLKEHGLSSVGLFSQIIPRLAAKLPPRYHPPASLDLKLEYAIMCLPRCGSTLVSRELKDIGAGDPVEHFRGFVQDLLRERAVSRFDLIRWWELLRAGRQVDGVFASKIIWDFWKMAERFMLDEEREHIFAFLKRVPVVYIERADKYAQAASDVIARRTGVWHLWNEGMKESYQDKLVGVQPDLAEAVAAYQKFRKAERELGRFLEKHAGSVIRIDFEELSENPKQAIARAARALGVDVPPGYESTTPALQPTTSEAHRLLGEQVRREVT